MQPADVDLDRRSPATMQRVAICHTLPAATSDLTFASTDIMNIAQERLRSTRMS